MRRRKNEERSSEEEMDGGTTHDVRDESGRTEGCSEVSGHVEKTDHVDR